MLPSIGASMHDAGRTRENEGLCICEGCDNCPEVCGENAEDCIGQMREAAAEAMFDAWREAA